MTTPHNHHHRHGAASLALVATLAVSLLNISHAADADIDGMEDNWELSYGFNPASSADAGQDADNDSLSNLQEHDLGTHPRQRDTDKDWLRDGYEVSIGTNPLLADSDGDGVSDFVEAFHGLDPNDSSDGALDLDSDGVSNRDESIMGTNIASAASRPESYGNFTESFEDTELQPGLQMVTAGNGWVRRCITAQAYDGNCFYKSQPPTAANPVSAITFKYYSDMGGVLRLPLAHWTSGAVRVYLDGVPASESSGWAFYDGNPVFIDAGAHEITVTHEDTGGFNGMVALDYVQFFENFNPHDRNVASIQVLTSNPQLGTDQSGANSVTITALVQDIDGLPGRNANVYFSWTDDAFAGARDGVLVDAHAVADNNGIATAQLNGGGNPTNRIVTATARAGEDQEFSASVAVDLTGTQLPTHINFSMPLGDSYAFGIGPIDSTGELVPNSLITVTSATGNGIAPPSAYTEYDGIANFNYTATVTGQDTVNVSSDLNAQTNWPVFVSPDMFLLTAPVEGSELDTDISHLVTLQWLTEAGNPVADTELTLSTTRGSFTVPYSPETGGVVTVYTNEHGFATANISSAAAGPAVIQARNYSTTLQTIRNVEFKNVPPPGSIFLEPHEVIVQPDQSVVVAGNQTTISARVLNVLEEPLENIPVSFGLSDPTGGFMLTGNAVTNSDGVAVATYIAGNVASDINGVTAFAYATRYEHIGSFALLTVTDTGSNLSMATINLVNEVGTTLYAQEWFFLVTDALGNPQPNTSVDVSAWPDSYRKGIMSPADPLTEPLKRGWQQRTSATCANEDPDRTGELGGPDGAVDVNNNGQIDPGVAVVVAPVPPVPVEGRTNACWLSSIPSGAAQSISALTDANGLLRVCIFYPQNFGLWHELALEASTNVLGTDYVASSNYWLPMSLPDQRTEEVMPPNLVSPYGTADNCAVPD